MKLEPHSRIKPLFRPFSVNLFFCLIIVAPFTLSEGPNSTASTNQTNNQPLSDTAQSQYEDSAELESVERIISVNEKPSDKKIKLRLQSIFNGSGKYSDLEIEVKDGLVFIDGIASEPKYIAWSSNIAKNIEGVVGVVNNIDVKPIDYFTWDPIKTELLKLWFKALEILPLVIVGLVSFAFFFFLSKPLSTLLVSPLSYLTDSQLIQIVLRRTISTFIILIGFYFFLRIAGLTQIALAIISGTGVLGLILGFAFRDIAENFISSLLISVQRPFLLGDVIEVNGFKGLVTKVTARGTTLIDFDGNHIQIPNATIYKNIIQNFSANPKIRGVFSIGVGYDASIKLAQDVGVKLMKESSAVLDDPEPQILVDSLGSSTINLKIYFWIDSRQYSLLKVSSILMRGVMREFEKNGISMPDDAREIIFPQGVPVIQQVPNDVNEQTEPNQNKVYNSKRVTKSKAEKEKLAIADEPSEAEDLSSETEEIRQQANNSRAPEEGSNIL